MDNTTGPLIGLFLIATAVVYLIFRVTMERSPKPPAEPARPDPLAPDLAAMLPALPEARQELQRLLWTAGYYRPSALNEYLAVRAILVLAAVVATGIVAVTAAVPQLPVVLAVGLAAALLGYSAPRVVLGNLAAARAQRLTRGLPLAMDVLGLCLTAGHNLLNSLAHTTRELARSCPDLATELQIVHRQARMHSLETALMAWAGRLDISEVRTLALMLVQSERLGTDMVGTLMEVADSQRTVERHKVEAQANRANFWMLFPTLFCLWVASALLLVGPVYLEFWQYRKDQMKTLLGNAAGQVERTTRTPTATTPPAAEQGP